MRLDELFHIDEEAGVGLVIPGVNTTKDVGPNAIQSQAAKLGIKVDTNGIPPIASTNGRDALREAIWPDMHGFWIDEFGHVETIEHRRDLHHVDIAYEKFGDDVDPEGTRDEYALDAAFEAALMQGWVHGSFVPGKELGIMWRRPLTPATKAALLSWWKSGEADGFSSYRIDPPNKFLDELHDEKDAYLLLRRELGRLNENNASPLSFPGTKAWQKAVRDAIPGTPEWFKVWFNRPYLTNGRAVSEGRKRKNKTRLSPYYGVWWGSRDEDNTPTEDGE